MLWASTYLNRGGGSSQYNHMTSPSVLTGSRENGGEPLAGLSDNAVLRVADWVSAFDREVLPGARCDGAPGASDVPARYDGANS